MGGVAPGPAVRAEDLWKVYPGPRGVGVPALRGVSLEAGPGEGEVVALWGRSGSGKTALLHLLAGLDRPTRGRVEVEGNDLAALGERGRTRLRRTRIGFVFQFFNLLPTLTALENVVLALELMGRHDEGRALEALEAVGLGGMGHRFPHELSGGEQQRVAVARARGATLILATHSTRAARTADRVLRMVDGCLEEAGPP